MCRKVEIVSTKQVLFSYLLRLQIPSNYDYRLIMKFYISCLKVISCLCLYANFFHKEKSIALMPAGLSNLHIFVQKLISTIIVAQLQFGILLILFMYSDKIQQNVRLIYMLYFYFTNGAFVIQNYLREYFKNVLFNKV